MRNWKIGLTLDATKGTPVIMGVLTALMAWKRLSEPAKAAVEVAYPDGRVSAHGNTISALHRHGFIERELGLWYLTPAGREVYRWVSAA